LFDQLSAIVTGLHSLGLIASMVVLSRTVPGEPRRPHSRSTVQLNRLGMTSTM